jgi:hypothetical protein
MAFQLTTQPERATAFLAESGANRQCIRTDSDNLFNPRAPRKVCNPFAKQLKSEAAKRQIWAI